MNIINVENITKSYTERKLFSKASFYVQENEKIGIIGINGTGKSTLLKIVAGIEEPEEGTVTKANHVVINYLSQNPQLDSEKTVLESLMEQLVSSDLDEQHRWTLESDAKAMLMRFQINDFDQRMGELSGGQRKRVALVAAVLKPCDVLIMDEPTNHLDYDMVEWLEDYLRKWRGALIMVTHDRYFLDSVCNRIVEIDKGQIYSYDCNYTGFLERKVAREESARVTDQKRKAFLRKEIEWIRRGAQARSTKQKARIQRYEAARDQKGIREDNKLELSSISSRMGRTTIELDNISKSYEDILCVKDFSYIFLKNDRVGFVGKNGCGKTTLMRMIAGELEPDAGSVQVGQTIKLGYYSQEIQLPDENMRVINFIKETAEFVRTTEGLVSASVMLDRFLFPPDQQYSIIGKLSGGERRRLNLLKVLMEAPNVLILDEPTNDLDTETLGILEDYLDNYEGIVITVSHDRYFLDRVVRRVFAFEGQGQITQYEGGYTDYMAKRPEGQSVDGPAASQRNGRTAASQENGQGDKPADSRATWGHEKKVKFTYKEQKEYETIEADIAELEAKIEQLEKDIITFATSYGKLTELTAQKETLEEELLEKMERWEYLEGIAEQLS